MNFDKLTTEKIVWDDLPRQEINGTSGKTVYAEIFADGYRLRRAEYSANYRTDGWCDKGHIIHCIKGTITLHFKNKADLILEEDGSIIIGSNDTHMASTGNSPVTLIIIDKA